VLRVCFTGTSSNVYVDILGSEGSCLDCKLEEDERDFQTGSTCKFVVVGAAVGQPRALVFRVDLAGFSPSWLLKEAELHLKGKHGQARDPEDDEGLEGRCWRAKADTWLSQQGKTQLEVPLVPVDDRPSSPGRVMLTCSEHAVNPRALGMPHGPAQRGALMQMRCEQSCPWPPPPPPPPPRRQRGRPSIVSPASSAACSAGRPCGAPWLPLTVWPSVCCRSLFAWQCALPPLLQPVMPIKPETPVS
jgi:hypothetical protein